MIDFQNFKREYINENLPKLYAGELDVTTIELICNVNFEQLRKSSAIPDMYKNP